ncbi:hypothetical protein GH714_037539 [Hevea brasiliensis]|uniref:Digalactosyldiacylglycerol synthase n=1 Tax=Hevea brasiliensis TaxID=3981 RepID=A0A6A6KNF4_HEVBR|nr:hypothetical protein GH714_037539 [Hevea brasiliensis]
MDGVAQPSTSTNAAFSFISKGWREVRDSADADLQLMRARANSFKNLANSFDRELENFFNSASTSFSVHSFRSSTSTKSDFVKKLQPKISEFRRVYSAPEISKRVLEKWGPRAKLGIDLSAIRNAMVAEVEDGDRDGIVEFRRTRRPARFREFWGEWKEEEDQELVYPNNLTFNSAEEQENYIRNWLEDRIGFKADFKISFYPGKFSKERRSIIPAGDTSQFIPSKDADIAILEEPEHLNWYHHGKRWTDKFNHVVGVVHTNYLEYIKRERNGALQAFLVKHINNWVIRAYCNKVLRLSAATQDLPKSVICNVHGVNPKFLKIGEKIAAEGELGQQAFSKGAYFLEDAREVQIAAKRLDLKVNFLNGRDHADDSLLGYKVFINPSVSDVLCTATAEALAMGKFVVCADHPSNEFFRSFPNCLTYKTSEDFVAKVKEALANEPKPLTPEQRYNLSWEAATERFMQYSELSKVLNDDKGDTRLSKTNGKSIAKAVPLPNMSEMIDGGLAFAHYCLTGNEFLRLCTGAIPGTRNYDKQHCKDLHLLPPQVENPIYGW